MYVRETWTAGCRLVYMIQTRISAFAVEPTYV
jgi:hypothetical protein